MKLIKDTHHHYITKDGRVFNDKTKRFLKPQVGKVGYKVFDIWEFGKSKKYYLHRLLCQAYIPNPLNKRTVNHKDGNKLNNDLSNLEWMTDL